MNERNRKIAIYFATETGNAEELADSCADAMQGVGFCVEQKNLSEVTLDEFRQQRLVLLISSTWGDGEPPTDAEAFYSEIVDSAPLGLSHMQFSVLALGDESYEHFCKCGRDLDEHLERHGASRLSRRVDCDVDFEDSYQEWVADVINALGAKVAA